MLDATFAAGGRPLRTETLSTQENGNLLVQVGHHVAGIAADGQSFEDPGKFVSVSRDSRTVVDSSVSEEAF